MKGCAAVLTIAAGFAAADQSCGQQNISHSYRPAMYTSVAGVSQELKVFPLNGRAFSIALPFPLGNLFYSVDGRALYADHLFDPRVLLDPRAPSTPGLFKIEFDPTRVSPVPGSDTFLAIYSFAVSARRDKVVVLGFARGGKKGECGIFELSLTNGRLRTIVENLFSSPLDPLIYTANLSLSADGARVTLARNHHLELIDLMNGKVTTLEEGIEAGSWSPDGKWLAVVKDGTTALLDASTLMQRRSLGVTRLKWSPDSRYMLNDKSKLMCGLGEAGTLEMVDVETGKRTEVESSRCLIDRNTTGWLSSEVAR